jgi:hypothetical protein
MSKSDYVRPRDDAFAAQLDTYKTAIPAYASDLAVDVSQSTSQAADSDYFRYVLQCQAIAEQSAQQWTAWKSIIRNGGTPPTGGAPTPPVFPPAAAAVAPGIEPRFRSLVKQNKANANYTSATGEALGVEGAEQTPPVLSSVQPDLSATVSGASVRVGWGWGGNAAFLEMCEIHVDCGDGQGFRLLTYDSTPNYIDTEPHPVALVKWTYKAIYRVADAQVGMWSKPVTVTVGG